MVLGNPPKSHGPQNGSLLLIGGSLTGSRIIHEVAASLAGNPSRWVIIPTAAGDSQLDVAANPNNLVNIIGQPSKILHTRNREEANTEKFVAPLHDATAVWIQGGRQYRLMDAYDGTRTITELRKVLDRGGLIAGTSAGATIQGSYLVRGAPSDDNSIVMYPGREEAFGFLSNVAVDQHVGSRNRDSHLSAVVQRYPHLLGVGIDDETAIFVRGNTMQVIGQGRVLITDGQNYGGAPFHVLRHDDQYDLVRWSKL